MQILPALAALISAGTPRNTANAFVIAMTAVYAAFTGWTFHQAISGAPFAG